MSQPHVQPNSAVRQHRVMVAILTLAALVLAWINLTTISQADPWYRNADMNLHNMADALALNAGTPPHHIDQPAVPTKFLLALDFRVRHFTGGWRVWNLKKFNASPTPLQEIPQLIHLLRVHSRVLIIGFILCAGWLVYRITREITAAGLAIILFCGSPGILFHGLLSRPEVLCVLLGNILALLCTWQATATPVTSRRHLWLFLAGVFGGFAVLEKMIGVCYLAMCFGWCWLAAARPAHADAGPCAETRGSREYGWELLPVGAGLATLWLLFQLTPVHETLGPVATFRLRLIAMFVAMLPVLALWPGPKSFRGIWVARGRELAAFGGGILLTLPVSYLLLRAVLPDTAAADYMARVLRFMLDPFNELKGFADSAHPGRVVLHYIQQDAGMFLAAAVAALAAFFPRSVPLRLKALIALQLAGSLVMLMLLSRRHYTPHYGIYYVTPLVLVLALSLAGLMTWWRQKRPAQTIHWFAPLALVAGLVLVLNAFFLTRRTYRGYQDDAQLPVSELTLTLIFDHEALPWPYREVMARHYVDRAHFRIAIDRYLADPANRY